MIDRGESSFAGITKFMFAGSVFVSTIEIIGIFALIASLIADLSFLASTTIMAPGGYVNFKIPPMFFSRRPISF